MTVMGASEAAIVVWSATDVFFGIMNHANVRLRLVPLIYVFVGPEMHRWHHARDPREADCNFGNNLSIFDWLFGTARVPGKDPAAFGIEDEGYPQGSLVRQTLYAFRKRMPARPAR
jgi:sterol desaturase/sphingolipid hydroxylase (fatty acid hydroxylase superfamily)